MGISAAWGGGGGTKVMSTYTHRTNIQHTCFSLESSLQSCPEAKHTHTYTQNIGDIVSEKMES